MSITTINPSQVYEMLKSGRSPVIIDVRTPGEYAGAHVEGARLMPLDTLDPAIVAAQRAGAEDAIYVICQAGGRAAKACERLAAAGVTPIYSIEGGTSAWEKLGFPVQRSGKAVMSLERQVRIAAGALVFGGVVLGWTVHRYFLGIPAFVGAGLMFAGITDYCGMGMLLAKMPWNRRSEISCG